MSNKKKSTKKQNISQVLKKKRMQKKLPKGLLQADKLFQKGDFLGAEHECKLVLQTNQHQAEAILILGKIATSRGQFNQAKQLFERSIQLAPKLIEAHFHFGVLLEQLGEKYPAMNQFRHCVEIDPTHEAGQRLGKMLLGFGYVTDAINLYNVLLKFEPSNPLHHLGLALVLNGIGEIEAGFESLNKALSLDENLPGAINNLLFSSHYHANMSQQTIYNLHVAQAKKLAITSRVEKQKCSQKPENRKIRIGYISADFHVHSVTDFFEPLLQNHDRTKYEIYCYYNNDRVDDVTNRLIILADHWLPISSLPDKQVVKQIESDQIDILIDLSGHTANNRLSVFTYKPAPIQVTWLGYPNTTGLAQIDYRFTDEITDPIGKSEQFHTEELIRLPKGFLCYRCIEEPQLAPRPPYCDNKLFTFGSFNNLSKITKSVIEVWARILNQSANSQIIIKGHQFIDNNVKHRYQQLFEQYGVDLSKVKLVASIESRRAHLELYNQVDLALDSFPYNGTTTTCEALWMGVPTVTYCGDTHVSRVGASILTRVGLENFIATNADDYVAKALAIACAPSELISLKSGLRKRMQESDLGDGKQFATQVESAYQNMLSRL